MAVKRCFLVAALAVVAFGAVAFADETTKEESAVISVINEIDNEPQFPLFGGLTVERSADYEVRAFGARSTEDLAERAVRYLASHTLKFSVPSEENTVEGEPENDSRSSRLKKMLLPLLLALKLKMAVVLPILLAVVKFISLKGLIAVFTVLKDLFQKKQERVTTAYITSAQPVNAEIVHQDWNRNGQAAAHELAYGAYPYATLA
uniref:Protein osiris 15 n=1 Tax=Anopheles atroparvus TaxID=41427 RepID=A0AAG5CMW2_ANOAO